jgi:hypothetical protein
MVSIRTGIVKQNSLSNAANETKDAITGRII